MEEPESRGQPSTRFATIASEIHLLSLSSASLTVVGAFVCRQQKVKCSKKKGIIIGIVVASLFGSSRFHAPAPPPADKPFQSCWERCTCMESGRGGGRDPRPGKSMNRCQQPTPIARRVSRGQTRTRTSMTMMRFVHSVRSRTNSAHKVPRIPLSQDPDKFEGTSSYETSSIHSVPRVITHP